jgi:hypothetical protein
MNAEPTCGLADVQELAIALIRIHLRLVVYIHKLNIAPVLTL